MPLQQTAIFLLIRYSLVRYTKKEHSSLISSGEVAAHTSPVLCPSTSYLLEGTEGVEGPTCSAYL